MALSTDGTAPGGLMAAEIAEQPQALARLLDDGGREVREVAARIEAAAPRFVVLAARGTSDHAALYAKYLVETTLGLPAGLASPSTLTTYGAKPDFRDVLWVTVSQSGGSPDLVESTSAAADAGALTVAVTNAPDSPLAGAAAVHLNILAGQERAVAATKSYTAQLLALFLLVQAWHGESADAARQLPELAETVLTGGAAEQVAPRYRFVDRLITTGRGYAYPTAREAALKLMETSYLSAHAFSGADLLHGPLAMIDEDHPVIAIVDQGQGGAALRPVLARLAERGADVCLVGSQPTDGEGAAAVLPIPAGVDDRVAPILQILPLQQLAYAIAVARRHDPDRPRGLTKITETR